MRSAFCRVSLVCSGCLHKFNGTLRADFHTQTAGAALVGVGGISNFAAMNAVFKLSYEGEIFIVRPINLPNIENVMGTNFYAAVFPLASIEIYNWDHYPRWTTLIQTLVFVHFQSLRMWRTSANVETLATKASSFVIQPSDADGCFSRTFRGSLSACQAPATFPWRRRGPRDSRNIQTDGRRTSFWG